MKNIKTKFKDLIIFENQRFDDKRGYFRELIKKKIVKKNLIFTVVSTSKKNVLRGMHLQTKKPQDKFVSVVKGKILDVVIDCRKKSKTYGKHFKIILSDKNCKSLYIPAGFAHGFLTLAKENLVFYGCSTYRSAKNEVAIKWNDKNVNVNWPKNKKIISKKDLNGISIKILKKL